MLSPASNDLEPLIPEERLARIEHRLRQENPGLPENAEFVAYHQPSQWIEYGPEQIPTQIAELACFSIFVPHPKHPDRKGFGYLPTGRMFYKAPAHIKEKDWVTLEWEHRHSSEIESDPAYLAFKFGPLKEALAWYDSVKDLIVKPRGE